MSQSRPVLVSMDAEALVLFVMDRGTGFEGHSKLEEVSLSQNYVNEREEKIATNP